MHLPGARGTRWTSWPYLTWKYSINTVQDVKVIGAGLEFFWGSATKQGVEIKYQYCTRGGGEHSLYFQGELIMYLFLS